MPPFDLRHLQTLVALRDAGSLVEAAERVVVTQSALSHQLKALETRLGCPLFVRKSRPLQFTLAGQRLLALADEVLPRARAAAAELARMADGQSGRLFMAIECHTCFEWLLPAINAFREDWPDVELDIAGSFHLDPLPALATGDLDLVITAADPIDAPALAYDPLFGYEAQLAVGPRHPLAAREWVAPQDLAGETLIAYPVDRSRMAIFTRFLDPAGVVPARVRNAELTAMMVQLVGAGRGVACLPNWALHEYKEHNYVVARSLGEEGVWPDLHAAVRADDRGLPFIESFLNIVKAMCFENLVGIVPAEAELR